MTINTLPAVFENTPMDIIIIGGERWLRGVSITTSLGMKPNAIRDMMRRSPAEFDSSTTMVVELLTAGGPQLTRLFNRRGADLVGMKARSEAGKRFRRWVLDVLEGLADDMVHLPATGLPKGVMNDLQILWVEKRGGPALLRYFKMGLRNYEAAKLLDISSDVVRRRRRMAEALGLIDPPANLAALRKAPQFLRMLEVSHGQ